MNKVHFNSNDNLLTLKLVQMVPIIVPETLTTVPATIGAIPLCGSCVQSCDGGMFILPGKRCAQTSLSLFHRVKESYRRRSLFLLTESSLTQT